MTRLIAIVAGLSLIAFVIYRQGGQDAVRDQREDTLQRGKDISDAVKESDAAPDWRIELRNRHQ